MRKKIVIERAERLHQIPAGLFLGLHRKAKRAAARGVDVIDLTLANLQENPQAEVVETLCRAAREEDSHRYLLGAGLPQFRHKLTEWFDRKFQVSLNPDMEVLPLQGSWEGLLGLPLAFANPDDVVLLPDPCDPVYRAGAILAGAKVETMPLLERNDYLPNLQKISVGAAHRAKLLFLNYPNNPTTSVADLSFFQEVVEFARAHNVAVVHDATFSQLTSDDYQTSSFLQARGAKAVGVELYSLSKTHSLGGWHIGFAVGNRQLLAGLAAIRGCGYVGPAPALQKAAITAICHSTVQADPYARRREIAVKGLRELGWKVRRSRATPFLWMRFPERYSALGFSRRLFRRTGVLVTPGSGFGEQGEGYVRISLTVPQARLQMALSRIKEHASIWQRKPRATKG
ncbi:aminotransferase class I/II-fold pyridoxal phosphate-dependent enzyme [Candidatus Zixiibacteriota bacterium]